MEGSKCPHSWGRNVWIEIHRGEMGVGIQDNGCESDTVLGLRDPMVYRIDPVVGCMGFQS